MIRSPLHGVQVRLILCSQPKGVDTYPGPPWLEHQWLLADRPVILGIILPKGCGRCSTSAVFYSWKRLNLGLPVTHTPNIGYIWNSRSIWAFNFGFPSDMGQYIPWFAHYSFRWVSLTCKKIKNQRKKTWLIQEHDCILGKPSQLQGGEWHSAAEAATVSQVRENEGLP